MKKKTVAAMLVMCMALSATACGGSDTKETKTETTQDTGDKKDSASSDKKTSASAVRLVSVSDVSKYVTIGEYKGLTLDRSSVTVTDDDVQAEIDYNLEENGTEVNDGTVEEGDSVTINFTGTIDGKEFDGGSAEDYDLVIGEGGMIDGFEDGIIGMKKGETKELAALPVTLSCNLPTPKIKYVRGKAKRYIEGVYRSFKLSYSYGKGFAKPGKIEVLVGKKKSQLKVVKSISKKSGAKINMKKGTYRYFKLRAKYGDITVESKPVKIKA